MGSLMAGWSSSASRDMKSEKLRRNKSQIKEEIESYWKTKKRTEENPPEEEALHAEDEFQSIHGGSESSRMQRSISLPLGDRKGGLGNIWTRSNWAFLNEPPLKTMEGPAYKYAAQYHVADLGRVKKTESGTEMMAIQEGA
ncbi:hypothetical protein KSP39_PZI010842 [Platanthera zijinensis]|uniref:Uncharacterized protein n=1 Tax=Platanthera zijinensis TaxID=2320716 RepID=A0AAP0G5Z0_9ASPA